MIANDDVWEKKIQTWGFCSLIQVTIYFDDFISSTSGNFANNIVHFDKSLEDAFEIVKNDDVWSILILKKLELNTLRFDRDIYNFKLEVAAIWFG